MPRALGIELEADGIVLGCGKPHRCELVPHHDHILDFIHRRLLDSVSPRCSGGTASRPDGGRAFCSLLRRVPAFEIVRGDKIASGSPLIRFETTLVCRDLNAVDGNGKRQDPIWTARNDEVRYWSMTPGELGLVAIGDAQWSDVFDADAERSERFARARSIVAEIAAVHGKRFRDQGRSAR